MSPARFAAIVVAAGLLAGCGSAESKSSRPSAKVSTSTASSGEGGGSSSGNVEDGGSGGGGVAGGGGEAGGPSLGLEMVDEADTRCATLTAPAVQIYAAGKADVPFDRLVKVGARRAAGGSQAGGAVLFDADGTPKTSLVTTGDAYNFISSDGDSLAMIAQSNDGVVVGRYDDKGKQIGGIFTLASDAPANVAIGAGDGEILAVWGVPGTMRARGVAAGGTMAGDAFDFGAGTIDNFFTASVVRSGSGFAVAWTGNPSAGSFRTLMMTTDVTGKVQSKPTEIITTDTSHKIVKLVKLPTGYAALINADLVPSYPVVVVLDEAGKPVGDAHRFLGASYGWDIAVHNGELGLVAKRVSGEAEFRPLDPTGVPLGPWVCVTPPSDDLYHQAAIDDDADGYAILYRTVDGGESFSTVDHLGAALP